MEKPYPGKNYGCIDTAPPSMHTERQLSRLADALYAASKTGVIAPQAVYSLAPQSMRLEWNFARWSYVAE